MDVWWHDGYFSLLQIFFVQLTLNIGMGWLLQFLADPEMMKELRGKEVAKQPEELLQSFKLAKTTEQMEAEVNSLIASQKAGEDNKGENENESESESDE